MALTETEARRNCSICGREGIVVASTVPPREGKPGYQYGLCEVCERLPYPEILKRLRASRGGT